MSADRYQRESEFHDRVFRDDTRRPVSKYYSITGASVSFYRDYIIAHGAGGRVLEYGCGPYSQAYLMVPRGARVVGIDISPVAMALYRQQGPPEVRSRVLAAVMNAECLAFADNTFDLVCGTGILHHLDPQNCFREISRVLRPDGSAVFVEPLGHNPLINLYRKLTPSIRSADEHPLLASDLAEAGRYFNRVETRYFHLTSLAAVPLRRAPGFSRAVRTLDALDRMLFRLLPFIRKYAWSAAMVMAEPRKGCAPPPVQGSAGATITSGGRNLG